MTAARSRPLLGLVVPALLLGWWSLWSLGATATVFAPLDEVAATFLRELRDGQLLSDATTTVSRALTGFTLGASAGVLLGVAMAMSRPLEATVGPLFHALRQVPLLGWLPLIGLWLGNGDEAKLVMISLAAFYPSMLNAFAGVSGVDRKYGEVAEVYGFDAEQRFFRVLLPAASPMILTGLSQALAFAWIGTIGSELLLGTGSGLGATLAMGQAQQRMDIVLVAVATTGALGFALNSALLSARKRLLRWQPVAN